MKAFDNKLYFNKHINEIEKRLKKFDRLYLEVGGKLFDDYHAERVIPGFKKDNKIKLLKKLSKDLELIICVSAKSIDAKKERADYGTTYDEDAIRMINYFKANNLKVNSVVITLYNGEESVKTFENKLKKMGIKTYRHFYTKGYPKDVETVVSEEGYGKNEYIKTSKKLVLVTAPGASSGKLATSLSQIYHEYKKGIKSGYAKLETFPIWNLDINHPINVAYEAATVDIGDNNMIDSYHLAAYNKSAVNYNRDMEVFPIIKNILDKITGETLYRSPTDMGINYIKDAITDIEAVKAAALEEIARRYLDAKTKYKENKTAVDHSTHIKIMMYNLGIDENIITGREKLLDIAKKRGTDMAIIKLKNKFITGKETNLLTASSALFLNSLKYLAKIPDEILLLPEEILRSIKNYKKNEDNIKINELMMILASQEINNPIIKSILKNLDKFKAAKMHISYIPETEELLFLKNLGIIVSNEDEYKKMKY